MWKLKVLVQFVLAHLPGGERVNYLLQLLNNSHSPEAVGARIIPLAEQIERLGKYVSLEDSTVLEIGVGWDPISPLLFYVRGARTVYAYDHVRHIRFRAVKRILDQIEQHMEQLQSITSLSRSVLTKRLKTLREANDLGQLFEYASIVYVAPGDATKSGLADNSVDIVYSYAVLEHVPESVLANLTVESRRILKRHGIAYHGIDLGDHYVSVDKKISKVNFLQYPEWLWAFWVKNKISYHNRLREKQMLDIFRSHGANLKYVDSSVDPSDLDVLKTLKIDGRFAGMSHEELAVYHSDVIMSFEDDPKD